jgi:hypothetical protein
MFTAQLQVVYSIVSLPDPELADEESD